MEKEIIRRLINRNDSLKDFINGTYGYINYCVSGVPVCIFKEDVGVSLYYKLPYNPNFDYEKVVEFMKYAIPILSEMLEEERAKNLNI